MSSPTEADRGQRSDGEATRDRLLGVALSLFANQGYSRTSTRELAEAAQANIAAISYHFGDKAGLYRALFDEPMAQAEAARLADPALALPALLRTFYEGFLEPLSHGDEARLCMKLHLRELLEPTGLCDDGVVQSIRPQHEALTGALCRHLDAPHDDAIDRLAVCLAGLAVHLHVGRDVIDGLAPRLMSMPAAVERWVETLTQYALSIIEGEKRRRQETSRQAVAPRRRTHQS